MPSVQGRRRRIARGAGEGHRRGGDAARTNNGFLNDPKVSIPLPSALEKADRALSRFGMGGQADELKATMNHAAEKAVAQRSRYSSRRCST